MFQILSGGRLEFPATTPPDIKEMVTQRMWNEKPEERYTMAEVSDTVSEWPSVKYFSDCSQI